MVIGPVLALACFCAFIWTPTAALAAGPVETSVFAVQGVDVDVTDTDASAAKNKALVDVQVKAFHTLVGKLGTPAMVEELAKLEPKDIMPYLKSLSIEEEATSPGRYAGKFTVRFLPPKMSGLFAKYGVNINSRQSDSILVVPIWNSGGSVQLWEENPWRTAWRNLGATQANVPIIVALGDAEDSKIISSTDIVASDPVKLEAMRRRYDVQGILIASAEPQGSDSIHVKIEGDTPIGRVKIDKIYAGDDGTIESATLAAVNRFQAVMVAKYNSDEAKLSATEQARKNAANAVALAIPVAVPFSSPSQWNGIRSRILATPGVRGVDVSSLGADGAVIRLLYSGGLDPLKSSFEASGLQFTQLSGSWVIQAP
jgi:hypothetical protein